MQAPPLVIFLKHLPILYEKGRRFLLSAHESDYVKITLQSFPMSSGTINLILTPSNIIVND